MSILLVEPSEDVGLLLQEVLESIEPTILVRTGEEAIEVLSIMDEQIKCIFIAPNLGKLNGWELLQIISDEENGWPHVKTIVYSPNGADDAVTAWQYAADDYLQIPTDLDYLVELLRCSKDERS